MSYNSWMETIWVANSAGPALNTSTTSHSLLTTNTSGPGRLVLPPNFFSYIGKSIQLKFQGIATSNATTAHNMTFNVMFNNTSVFGTQAMACNATTGNGVWDYDLTLTALAIGPSANLIGIGKMTGAMIQNSSSSELMTPATAPVSGAVFDGTRPIAVDFWGTWSVSNANDNIQILSGRIVALN